MEEQNFWDIIHLINYENDEIIDGEASLNLLSSYNYETLIKFEVFFRKKIGVLHNCKTISVFAIFNGDRLEGEIYLDFLSWVISKGESFYNKFIENPNDVADNILFSFEHGCLSVEELVCLADNAYELKFGGSFEDDAAPRCHVSQFLSYEIDEDLGCPFDDETLEKNYPKLWKGFFKIIGK